jgi:hypothetical protein
MSFAKVNTTQRITVNQERLGAIWFFSNQKPNRIPGMENNNPIPIEVNTKYINCIMILQS